MRLLLLAPPGAGKGTQGQLLAARFQVRHIAAGDLLRAEAKAGSRLGLEIAAHQARGDLVPDQIVLDLLTPVVVEAAAGGGYILDGFPRTLPRAAAAAELGVRLGVTLQAVVYLYAPEEVLTRRLLGRASQSGRADDTGDVIRHRLQAFAETTGPFVPLLHRTRHPHHGGRRSAARIRRCRHPGRAVLAVRGRQHHSGNVRESRG